MSARLAALLAVVAAGCGGEEERLRVAAASSLQPAFEALASARGGERPSFSFAGSDVLAAQIRRGARPDVYASADERVADALHAAGRLERPIAFATNELVIAVPRDSRYRRPGDLARRGLELVIAAPGVPAGRYARRALAALPSRLGRTLAAAVRSEEPDAAAVAAKVLSGAADAGLVYASDVRAAPGRLRAIRLPAAARPRVRYAAAVVRGARDPEGARAFVASLRGPSGRAALRAAGLGAGASR